MEFFTQVIYNDAWVKYSVPLGIRSLYIAGVCRGLEIANFMKSMQHKRLQIGGKRMKGETIRVAVLADTHGVLRPEVVRILETCDAVVHGGDFDNQLLYHKLSSDWPLYAVRGNNDRGWSGGLPLVKRFSIGGINFIMAHERSDIPSALGDTKIVIYGHSHMYQQQEINGHLWLNPGSCGYKRFTLPLSMAVLTISEGSYELETIWLEKSYGTPGAAIEQREKAKKNRYEKQQQKYRQKQAGKTAAKTEAVKQTEKETGPDRKELFLLARILRQKKAGSTAQWTAQNVNAPLSWVEEVYAASEPADQMDAKTLWEKLKRSHSLDPEGE